MPVVAPYANLLAGNGDTVPPGTRVEKGKKINYTVLTPKGTEKRSIPALSDKRFDRLCRENVLIEPGQRLSTRQAMGEDQLILTTPKGEDAVDGGVKNMQVRKSTKQQTSVQDADPRSLQDSKLEDLVSMAQDHGYDGPAFSTKNDAIGWLSADFSPEDTSSK